MNRHPKPRVFILLQHIQKTVRLPSAEFLCLLFLFFLRSSPPDVAPIESPERTHERTCERRDQSDLSFFPGPAPDGRVSLFLPIFFLTLSLSKSFKRDWPEVSSSWMTTERFRGKNQDMNHLRRVLRTLLELGNQKRTILPSQNPSFHLSSPDEWSGCPLTRKPSFYVFVSLSFSDTFKS